MLVTAEEAKDYINQKGALVFGQASWTATEEPSGEMNWVSCGDKNTEGIAQDYVGHYKDYPKWTQSLDLVENDKQCDWVGHIVIYKPIPEKVEVIKDDILLTADIIKEAEKVDYERVKLTLKSHDGKAMVKKS